jgi:MoxR-like ATPase
MIWDFPIPGAPHGKQGILFLDEITSAPPTVSAAAYQLILDRRLGDYVVPEGWVIFAAGNRQGDRGVTYSQVLGDGKATGLCVESNSNKCSGR